MYNPLHHAFAGLFIPLSLAVFVGAALAKDLNPENPFNAPAPLYWCPGKKPGQQLSTKQSADCHPVYDKETAEAFRERATKEGVDLPDRHPIKLVELQKAASTFSDRYHAFVSCCSTEPNARADILDLIDEANHLLEAAQQKGLLNSAGQGTLTQVIGSVAGARENLFRLQQRLERLEESQRGLQDAPYDTTGRMRIQIQEEEEAIRKDFRANKPPSSAPTGLEIQDTTLQPRIGGDIEDTKLTPNFGADIGNVIAPSGESLRPRRGEAIQDSALPSRAGMDALETGIPNSTGAEIEQKGNPEGSGVARRGIGSSIGDSELNNRRR